MAKAEFLADLLKSDNSPKQFSKALEILFQESHVQSAPDGSFIVRSEKPDGSSHNLLDHRVIFDGFRGTPEELFNKLKPQVPGLRFNSTFDLNETEFVLKLPTLEIGKFEGSVRELLVSIVMQSPYNGYLACFSPGEREDVMVSLILPLK